MGSDSFECMCPPGYTGALCESDIDECLTEPCQNGGTCLDDINSFSCDCPPEFSGPTCEVQVIFCSQNTCANGGTCFEADNGFLCACPLGYTGDSCETNIDECMDDPCENNATCVDLVGDFFCLCAPGFTGQFCNETIDFCINQTCSGNGQCSSLLTGFECECDPGYTGMECEVDINECESSPCENAATCVEGIGLFMCLCPQGYTGQVCETDINECASSPCENGATCVDNIGEFTCMCAPGFSGSTCATQTDFCIDQICYNGGTCISGQSGFICSCPAGWSGPQCEYADSVAVKLMSCGQFSHDFLNDSGYVDPVAFSNGVPAIYDIYEVIDLSGGLYWSAWIWQQSDTPTTLFSYEGMGFMSGTTELVSDISNQQLILYHAAQAGFGGTVYVINATLNNVSLSMNQWHHLSVIMWSNETVVVTVDGEYSQQGTFGRQFINEPGSEVPLLVFFSIPNSFNFSLARSSASLSPQSQHFTGIMRGVAIANVPSNTALLSLDQCLLNCIGGEGFCSNGASCQDLFGPSRRCSCSRGFTGLQCQYVHDRYSFDGSGYAELTNGPPMIVPLTFDFKTESTRGELYSHTGLFAEGSFSLSEEAIDVDFEFCDSSNVSFTLQPPPSQMLSDNQWHRVSVTAAELQLDSNPPLTNIIQQPSLSCNTSNPGRIILGSFSDTVDTSNNFIGCLRDLIYDDNRLDAPSIELVGGAQFGCDRDTAQFFAASYIELPNFNSREAQTISFDISTLASEAVLYFSRRVPADATGPNPSDFVAIYLEGGQVAFTFNLGEGDITVRSDQVVNDGNWHRIEAMQNSTLSWLSVDGVRVHRPVTSQLELLDTTGSVFLGGVPDSEQFPGFTQYASFDGCLRDLEQNRLAADLRNSTASQNIGYGTCN